MTPAGSLFTRASIRFAAAISIFTNDLLRRKIEVILPRRFRDKWPGIHLADQLNIRCFHTPRRGFYPVSDAYLLLDHKKRLYFQILEAKLVYPRYW